MRVDPNCITIRKVPQQSCINYVCTYIYVCKYNVCMQVRGGCGWNAAVRGIASTDRYTVRVDELGLHKVAMVSVE